LSADLFQLGITVEEVEDHQIARDDLGGKWCLVYPEILFIARKSDRIEYLANSVDLFRRALRLSLRASSRLLSCI
jgi:hypothetical protein